ncbi:predicted protein [Naegleria gruberi]|uniref:Predicted protein n=1 Tax=Naegleria gruberi TaxID=5762 RepID=D2VI76_NAEGR|nr:uncharacterized protein NAEGRDRAFT_58290 [Naegleria gruberi]EFC43461.1 predicted protein [Naegleria gruberi]|eukprot:XP_002676205.1 predicted protein [Naegleria gruberi strain NEG-M]
MPPRKKSAKKKEEEESDEEILEEPTEFNITIDDDVKPFTNEYDELVRFDSLEKLPSEVVFEIFSFLPSIPYYFKLQLLSKFYKEKFQEIITQTKHLDLAPLNLQHHAIWPKVCQMIKDCGSSLKSIQFGELNYKWNEIKEAILKKCSKLEELALVTPTMYFTSLFRKDGSYYGYYGGPTVDYSEDKKNRDVWCDTLTTLNVIGLEKPRKGRRNHSYLLTSATFKYILEKFPKLKNINFILTNYTEMQIQSLYDAVVRNRKRLLEWREKGGSTDGLYERTGIWYEEAIGIVDFDIPHDLKINVQGSIGKLSSIDAAKNIVEVYNINPNTKFEFLFQKNSNGTLLDQIIGSRAAYKQKHQVLKLVPEKLAETPTGQVKPTLSHAISNSDIPDSVINYIFDFIVKPSYALNVFTNTATGETIIHQLIAADRLEPLRLLLDMLKEQERISKIINIPNNSGDTALHMACKNNKIQLAKDLVNHYSANKNLYNADNQFPYDLLKVSSLSFLPEILKPDEEKVEELKESIKQKEKEMLKAQKKKSPKKSATKRKKEEKESEEEEEEKPRRSTRKKTKKEIPVDLTDDDEQEVVEVESEEEVKPKRKPRTSKKK